VPPDLAASWWPDARRVAGRTSRRRDTLHLGYPQRQELEASLTNWIVQLELPSLGAGVAQISLEGQTQEEKRALCRLGYLEGPDCEGCGARARRSYLI